MSDIASVLNKNSVNQFNAGKFIIHEKDGKTEGFKMSNGLFCFNNNDSGSYIEFIIEANSIAKINIYGYKADAQLTFKIGSTTKTFSFSSDTKYQTGMIALTNDTNSPSSIRIYRSSGVGALISSLRVEVFDLSNLTKDSALVNTDVEANSAKDIIRIVSTISGVAFDNISSIKISLYKDGVAANGNPLSITKVYTSVTNAADLYGTADNTYYSILKITNAQDIKGSTLTVSTIVTYSDGSSCTSYTKSFVVPSAS